MALLFDGINDKVDYGDVTGIDSAVALTIAFWIKQITWAANDGIMHKSGGAGHSTVLIMQNGATGTDQVRMYCTGTNVYGEVPVGAVPLNTWTHMAWVFDGGGAGNSTRLLAYANGVAQTLAYGGSIGTALADAAANTLRLANNYLDTTFGNFAAAHLKIWNAVLTPGQVKQEMHSYRPAKKSNLILWSPLDDAQLAKDYSQSGFPGTVTEATQVQGPPVSYGRAA